MLAWVTNMWTNPIWTLNLVQVVLEQTPTLVENFAYEATKFWTVGLVMKMANPLLESFREPLEACVKLQLSPGELQ